MAWFRCSVGGGGGGETDVNLIVTCSPGFAGSTISCTNGSKTYTQTCPSSSPYTVTFENIEKGTWTISGIASGQTFTKSVTISDYTAELTNIPNGATVTPVNDIQIWLHCANIWNKTYTTISQVLSDTSTLLALISSNNAADYMARSTNWASSVSANQTAMGYIGNNNYCATQLLANSTWCTAICNSTYFESVLNVKVPTMTSDTTPSGTCIATSVFSDFYAYKAFNNALGANNYWVSNTGDIVDSAIGYDFGRKIAVNKIKLTNVGQDAGLAQTIKTFILQGYNTSWVNITGVLTVSDLSLAHTTYFTIQNSTKYQKYRLLVKSNNGSTLYASIDELQFYGRA